MYQLTIKRQALKEINSFPEKVQKQIILTIEELKTNPYPNGSKKLVGSIDRWRIRIGDYRILYKINNSMKQIFIFRVLHRKDVYR